MWRGGQLGPRGDYAPRLEILFTTSTVLGSAVILGSLALLFVGLGLASVGRNSEKNKLAQILKDPTAASPSKDFLQPYGEPHSFLFAQLLAGCSGTALIVSSTVLFLGAVEWESFRDSALIFGSFRGTSLVTTALSLVLLLLAFAANAMDQSRGRDLRNHLMQRWPTLPVEKSDDEGNVPHYRAGPALSGPRGR